MMGAGLGLLGLGMTPAMSWTSRATAAAPPAAPTPASPPTSR